jgi:uncharacterized membrane protein
MSFAIAIGVTALIIFATFALRSPGQQLAPLPSAHLHAPRLDLIAEASPAIKIHLATVLAALVLTTLQMVRPKGDRVHRVTGWVLAVLLITTAIAALFIHGPFSGHFSPLHLFSIWTLVAVPIAVVAARNHKVALHGRMMAGLYFGGMLLAGALTLMPGRLLWWVFFG